MVTNVAIGLFTQTAVPARTPAPPREVEGVVPHRVAATGATAPPAAQSSAASQDSLRVSTEARFAAAVTDLTNTLVNLRESQDASVTANDPRAKSAVAQRPEGGAPLASQGGQPPSTGRRDTPLPAVGPPREARDLAARGAEHSVGAEAPNGGASAARVLERAPASTQSATVATPVKVTNSEFGARARPSVAPQQESAAAPRSEQAANAARREFATTAAANTERENSSVAGAKREVNASVSPSTRANATSAGAAVPTPVALGDALPVDGDHKANTATSRPQAVDSGSTRNAQPGTARDTTPAAAPSSGVVLREALKTFLGGLSAAATERPALRQAADEFGQRLQLDKGDLSGLAGAGLLNITPGGTQHVDVSAVAKAVAPLLRQLNADSATGVEPNDAGLGLVVSDALARLGGAAVPAQVSERSAGNSEPAAVQSAADRSDVAQVRNARVESYVQRYAQVQASGGAGDGFEL